MPKICSFDCIYCQLGRTVVKTTKREKFVEAEIVRRELKKALRIVTPDVITFSGVSEPTLASNISDIVNVIKEETDIPVAILTNASLIYKKEVMDDLMHFDIVCAKLDAPNQKIFEQVNRPSYGIKIDDIINGIKEFRKGFTGKLALQIMLVNENKPYVKEIANIARDIKPDEIQLDTPLRPCPVPALPEEEMYEAKQCFDGLNVIMVYDRKKPEAKAIDKYETHLRRPT
ncbi:MAG: radical SAM protein [Candidatus Diapherotrites archaeon]|nr:radical SAM protein [Candidatus Diapherotrites archaeon]